MQKMHWAFWAIAIVALSQIASSNPERSYLLANRATKIIRVAIVPICNPGLSCDPDLPTDIEEHFFRHAYGVSSFIDEISTGQTRVIGTVAPWLRPKKRLKSGYELVENSDDLLERSQIAKNDVDIVLFYLRLAGQTNEYTHIAGGGTQANAGAHKPALAYLVNGDILFERTDKKVDQTITPSINWAQIILKTMGVLGQANLLRCEPQHKSSHCNLARGRDPYSIFGDASLALAMPAISDAPMLARGIKLVVAKSDGSYRIDASRTRVAIDLPTPLRIHDSLSFDRVVIEQRRTSKFDRRLMRLQGKELTSSSKTLASVHESGAFLYLSSRMNPSFSTLLFDANPSEQSDLVTRSSLIEEFADTALLPGKPIQLFDTSITIEVTQISASSLTIKVAGLSR